MNLLDIVNLPKRTSMLRIISEEIEKGKEYLRLDDKILQQIHSPWNKEQIIDWASEYVLDEAKFGNYWKLEEVYEDVGDFSFYLNGHGDSSTTVTHRGDYYNQEEGVTSFSIDDLTLTIIDGNDKEYYFDIQEEVDNNVEKEIYY